MISDFVSERGGGLLMLGGRRAFAEGGYLGTPVEDVLPVVLRDPTDRDYFDALSVEITPAGVRHPVTGVPDREDITPWDQLPEITAVNPIREIKPGATSLLRGRGRNEQVVLATQRFGRGKSAALTIHDSWTWQMHADLPLEDQTHETFWSQMFRWLVSGVRDRVQVYGSVDRVPRGESVDLIAEVEDDAYLRVNNTDVTAHIRSPSGDETTVNMQWTIDRDGEYRTSFVPREDGLYEVSIEAETDGEFVASKTSYIQAGDMAREFYESEMRQSLLERISEETGGGFYTPDDAANLAEDIRYTESGTTIVEEHDLWDMPVIFLMLVTLVSGEWVFRKLRGLV
jgi:hypothetical protein